MLWLTKARLDENLAQNGSRC